MTLSQQESSHCRIEWLVPCQCHIPIKSIAVTLSNILEIIFNTQIVVRYTAGQDTCDKVGLDDFWRPRVGAKSQTVSKSSVFVNVGCHLVTILIIYVLNVWVCGMNVCIRYCMMTFSPSWAWSRDCDVVVVIVVYGQLRILFISHYVYCHGHGWWFGLWVFCDMWVSMWAVKHPLGWNLVDRRMNYSIGCGSGFWMGWYFSV